MAVQLPPDDLDAVIEEAKMLARARALQRMRDRERIQLEARIAALEAELVRRGNLMVAAQTVIRGWLTALEFYQGISDATRSAAVLADQLTPP